MILDAANLERAIARWWFTHPADDGKPLMALPRFTQNTIVAAAIEIQQENSWQPSNSN